MKRLILLLSTMTLLSVVVPSNAAAQGRGYGRRDSAWGKKCTKFVNCHDARDGKWGNRDVNRRAYRNRVYMRTRYHNRFYTTHSNRTYGTYRVRRPSRY
jgi:hypothetical protein